MRLLTTDELFAVSGGSYDGTGQLMLDVHDGNHPSMPANHASATSTAEVICRGIGSGNSRDLCLLSTALSANCEDGWTLKDGGREFNTKGVKGRTTTIECKKGGSDSGSDDSSDSGGDSGGNDSGDD